MSYTPQSSQSERDLASRTGCPRVVADLEAAEARLAALEAVARAFVAKYDLPEIRAGLSSAYQMAHVHGWVYTGPDFGDELDALRSALSSGDQGSPDE